MNREPVKIICQIIKDFMELDDSQIWIYNQDYKIPNTAGLFVVVSLLGTRPYGLRQNEIENEDGSMSEEQILNTISQYQIDIQSKDNSARLKKEEVLLSLNAKIKHTEELMNAFQSDEKLHTLYTGMNIALKDFKETIEKHLK